MAPASAVETAAEVPRPESIEELFTALEIPLLTYARRFAPNADMAEDFIQEAFLRLHAQFGEIRSPKSWLYRTVHNLALNHQRDEAKVVPMRATADTEDDPVAALVDSRPLPGEQLSQREGVRLMEKYLEKLDPRDQEIIQLKFHENLSYQQISERTGLSVGHVGYLLHHSLKSLAADLATAGLVP